jgi:hypothetical protein
MALARPRSGPTVRLTTRGPVLIPTLQRILAFALLAMAAATARAQATPNADYTDMWWLPSESGWGLSITQHAGTNRAYAVWYTYDPRYADASAAGNSEPLWLVMNGGTWIAPDTLTGSVYVTKGTPYYQGWNPGAFALTPVGTFTFTFSDASHGTFRYDIAPPGGLAVGDPAFGLPPFSGTKSITRQGF